MPVALPNTTTTDNYPVPGAGGAQVTARDVFSSGWFTVANAAVIAQYSYGVFGQFDPSPDFYLAPGTYPLTGTPINPINGIRFKSAVAGTPAQIWGAFFYKDDPVLQSSSEFISTISGSGSVTPPSTGALILIQDQLLTGLQVLITFANIPQTYKHLMAILSGRSDQAVNISGVTAQINADAGANYNSQLLDVAGATVTGSLVSAATSFTAGAVPGGNLNANLMSSIEIYFPNYTGNRFKSMNSKGGFTDAVNGLTRWIAGDWLSTAAITQLDFRTPSNWTAGTRMTLYAYN